MIPKNYENLNVLHENTMPQRAYYIPASERRSNLIENREASDRIQMLNDVWKFKYYESIYEVPEDFYAKESGNQEYDEIPVPSVWQISFER